MRNPMLRAAGVAAALALALSAGVARADDDHDRHDRHERHDRHDRGQSVTVSFGAGLNTAQEGNKANHHVLPKLIRVKKGGVVNFVVAGFHHVIVYKPGKAVEHVVVPASGLFIDDLKPEETYYVGIHPQMPPPEGLSNAFNRVESVSFADEGTHLVICNVTPHFLDGMWAWIVVED